MSELDVALSLFSGGLSYFCQFRQFSAKSLAKRLQQPSESETTDNFGQKCWRAHVDSGFA